MKKYIIVLICMTVIFTLGYTTYANNVKNQVNKPSIEKTRSISKSRQYDQFIKSIPSSLSMKERARLIDEIEKVSTSTDTSKDEDIKGPNPEVLKMMKMQYLTMYFDSLKKQNIATSTAKTNKKVVDDKELDETIEAVLNATSVATIAEMRMTFMEKNYKGFKRPVTKGEVSKEKTVKRDIPVRPLIKKEVVEPVKSVTSTSAVSSTTTDEITASTTEVISDPVFSTSTPEIIASPTTEPVIEATTTEPIITSEIIPEPVVPDTIIPESESEAEEVASTTEHQ